jgi:peptide/nickel transport system substrate-binding protein
VEGGLDKIEILDDYTLLIKTKSQIRPMLNWFVAEYHLPKANEELGDKLNVTAVGTGPYRFVEYIPNNRFVVEANPDYWGEKPKLQKIIFRVIPEDASRVAALEAGEVDMITEVSPDQVKRIEGHANLQVISTPTVRVMFIRFREDRKPLDDVRVRQALNYGVDKKEIVKYILGDMGSVASAPIHPLLMGYNKDLSPYEYDPKRRSSFWPRQAIQTGSRSVIPRPTAGTSEIDKSAKQLQANLGR